MKGVKYADIRGDMLNRLKKSVHISGFEKYLIFSTRVDITGVILIYTWDTFLGHPVCVLSVWVFIQ